MTTVAEHLQTWKLKLSIT